MDTFAEYILNEEELVAKMEITYYLSKKARTHFDKAIIVKTELARMFIDYMKLDVDRNLVLTACLLCNCKKVNDAQKIGKLHTYALDGALFLRELGFSSKFCKMCEEVNRYSESSPRERESDILELVDSFGGMILDRPERIGFEPEEALVLIEHRNLKDQYNRYLDTFKQFVKSIEEIRVENTRNMKPIKLLVKTYNEAKDAKEFMTKVCYEYSPKIDKIIAKKNQDLADDLFNNENTNPNRSLFAEATTRKIIGQAKGIASVNSNISE